HVVRVDDGKADVIDVPEERVDALPWEEVVVDHEAVGGARELRHDQPPLAGWVTKRPILRCFKFRVVPVKPSRPCRKRALSTTATSPRRQRCVMRSDGSAAALATRRRSSLDARSRPAGSV